MYNKAVVKGFSRFFFLLFDPLLVLPPSMIDEVRSHIEQLLSAGIIRKSKSPFASNVVFSKKNKKKTGWYHQDVCGL